MWGERNWKGCVEIGSYKLQADNVKYAATMGISTELLKKLNTELPYDPSYYSWTVGYTPLWVPALKQEDLCELDASLAYTMS